VAKRRYGRWVMEILMVRGGNQALGKGHKVGLRVSKINIFL
jgi:hypothetical protein